MTCKEGIILKNSKGRSTKFQTKLISAFIFTSIIPMLLFDLFSYYNTLTLVNNNYDEFVVTNLEKTQNNIDVSLGSYEDILYQIYTDDTVVELVDKINRNEDVPLARNQLRRILRGLFYTKEYLKSVTIIPKSGDVIFYDQLTASNTANSWMERYPIKKEQFLDEISAENKTHVYSTEFAAKFSSTSYYLFHLGHKIINYKDISNEYGVVIISIDEAMLKDICVSKEERDSEELNSFNFIVDRDGKIVSYIENSYLTRVIDNHQYEQFLNHENAFGEYKASTSVVHDSKYDWNIVSAVNKTKAYEQLNFQNEILIITIFASFIAIVFVIIYQTRKLTRPIKKIVKVMSNTNQAELASRIEESSDMSFEIRTMATSFNDMMERLEQSVKEVKEAGNRQREAEITALEAQINPHFLYNTLDTINWMAIDNEEYEISNAINALATILRYGIDNSNGIVTIKEEVDWLEKYLLLQKTRKKYTFSSKITVADDTLFLHIHKLLLQPFVENAIIHGFSSTDPTHSLNIDIKKTDIYIHISISDNGCGIDKETLDSIRKGEKPLGNKTSIGMRNAISRIKIYYGESAKININSSVGKGTTVELFIPIGNKSKDEGEKQ